MFELLGKKIGSEGEETDAPAPALDVNKTEYSLVGERINLKDGREGTSTSNINTHNGMDNQNKTRHASLRSVWFYPTSSHSCAGKTARELAITCAKFFKLSRMSQFCIGTLSKWSHSASERGGKGRSELSSVI